MKIVEVLLSWSADVNAKTKQQQTPLHLCAKIVSYESEEICRRLLNKKAKVMVKDYMGASPIHLACAAGNSGVLALLLERVPVNISDVNWLVRKSILCSS